MIGDRTAISLDFHPNWVVTAESINTFKTRLDTFWHNQDHHHHHLFAQKHNH